MHRQNRSFPHEIRAGKLRYAIRQVNSTNLQRASYEYYGSSDANGNFGDLKKVEIQSWQSGSWVTTDKNYYRYWKAGQPNGVVYGTKFALGAEAYARMEADGLTPETATNAQLADYADFYFEYDSERRITLEVTNAGTQTFEFEYERAL